ncbi:hypothetical protein TIFTF001_036835 [Ficus carica]|uniref:Rapid ALkalinization Factor n=1 Tax=Ficus carica TaxID=3494 RepID=A0AA88JBQ5_FICCA|nr:hypothetical protein TIFTF001_036835 [Ficus carica]
MVTTMAMLVLVISCMNANCCRAAVLLKSNATYQNCGNGGEADEYHCRLIAEDLELELLFDSHVSRMLGGDGPDPGTGGTGNGKKPAKPCGPSNPGNPYCNGKGQKPTQNCNKYNRSPPC